MSSARACSFRTDLRGLPCRCDALANAATAGTQARTPAPLTNLSVFSSSVSSVVAGWVQGSPFRGNPFCRGLCVLCVPCGWPRGAGSEHPISDGPPHRGLRFLTCPYSWMSSDRRGRARGARPKPCCRSRTWRPHRSRWGTTSPSRCRLQRSARLSGTTEGAADVHSPAAAREGWRMTGGGGGGPAAGDGGASPLRR